MLLEWYVKYDREVTVLNFQFIKVKFNLNKTGTLLTLTGPTQKQVAAVAMRVYHRLKQRTYSGKGAKIALHYTKRKTMKKK